MPTTAPNYGFALPEGTDPPSRQQLVDALMALDTNAARTDDTRFTNARTPSDESVTLGKIASSLIDPASGAGLRSLGTGASQAAAGNDARLSDQRTPSNTSVTLGKIHSSIIDPAEGAGLRTVGTTSGTVAAGDDSRFTTPVQKSLVDAKGDLIVATAADTVARLAVGADGQILSANSALSTGLEWIDAPEGGGGGEITGIPESIVNAKGDLIAATANDAVARLAVGSDGLALLADSSAATGLAWGTASDGTKIAKSLVDAKGDLIVATNNDTVARLAAGSNGQVLTVDGGEASGLKWATPATFSETLPASLVNAKGDLIAATANDTVTRLGVGTNGQILIAASGEATGLMWGNLDDTGKIAKSIVDAKGDLIVATAADTVARLAVGTDGYILSASSGQSAGMQWVAPTSIGALPVDGTTGQLLAKSSNDDYATEWVDAPSGGGMSTTDLASRLQQGYWNEFIPYVTGDVVNYGNDESNAIYVCTGDNTGDNPFDNPNSTWSFMFDIGYGPYDNGKGFVNHGSNASAYRPPWYASVEWQGSVEPANAINGDTWVVTP